MIRFQKILISAVVKKCFPIMKQPAAGGGGWD